MKFTKNLHLTQYQTNDTLSWRDRYNTDMRTIDAATSSTSAYVEDLVENMDKYNEHIESEIERLDVADDNQKKATASVLAYAQREALTREEEDNKLRAEIQTTTSSVMSSAVELINNLTENLTEEMTDIKKDVDKNSLHNVQDDARLDALEELTGNYGQISAQIQSNTSSISAMKLRLSKAEEQIVDQGTVIGEIQTEQATADMRLESLEHTTSAHADAISDINDLLTSYQPTVETVSILNGRMKVVEDTVHDQEDEISEIRTLAQQTNQIAEGASSTANDAISTATTALGDAHGAATKADTALAAANDANNTATTALGDAEAANTKAENALTAGNAAGDLAKLAKKTADDNAAKLANVTGAPTILEGNFKGAVLGAIDQNKRQIGFSVPNNKANGTIATSIQVEISSGATHGDPTKLYTYLYDTNVTDSKVSIRGSDGKSITLTSKYEQAQLTLKNSLNFTLGTIQSVVFSKLMALGFGVTGKQITSLTDANTIMMGKIFYTYYSNNYGIIIPIKNITISSSHEIQSDCIVLGTGSVPALQPVNYYKNNFRTL